MHDESGRAQARLLLRQFGLSAGAAPRAARTTPVVRTPGTIPHDKNAPMAAWVDRDALKNELGLYHEWRFRLPHQEGRNEQASTLLAWLREPAGTPEELKLPPGTSYVTKEGPHAGRVTNEALMAHFFQTKATTVPCFYLGTFIAAFVADMIEFRSVFVFATGNEPATCMDSWAAGLATLGPNNPYVPVLRSFWRMIAGAAPEQSWLMLGQSLASIDFTKDPLKAPANPIAAL
ncbi:hypothetical protein GXW74_14570 [Roseomonas eburnea]|uniref:Uncharacterized protein n=1 Tax=Neoroseomonas eburnea TaxID=1346889 RepID=A0A9X9XDC9_9PROT|nr:hypothetical protein [Neoroseomonas eburnea]MBR0681715.1 hypothetical protein [Neoroseomonas eburnea]